jgi:hypothetical protein
MKRDVLPNDDYAMGWKRQAVKLSNGVMMSIQASARHYCHPRTTNAAFYTSYEVGFVTKDSKPYPLPPAWAQYGEDDTCTSDVFVYVPVGLIAEFIEACGGIVGHATDEEWQK